MFAMFVDASSPLVFFDLQIQTISQTRENLVYIFTSLTKWHTDKTKLLPCTAILNRSAVTDMCKALLFVMTVYKYDNNHLAVKLKAETMWAF